MLRLANRLQNSEFARNVGTLASGTVLAQLILLGASPALTRLYGPEGFAVLALLMAIISSLSPGISGRYEIAIVVAKDQSSRRSLLVIAIWVAALLCGLMFLVLLVAFDAIQAFLNAASLGVWLLFAPLGLFLTAAVTALRYFANSLKNYRSITRLVVSQAAVTTALSITFGWAGLRPQGLLVATLTGFLVGILFMLFTFRAELRELDWRWTRETWSLAGRYKDFPLYSATTSVLDGITLALPVFFLGKYYPESIVGYYALLTRVATAPLAFVSQAVSQVHLKKIAELIHQKVSPSRYLRNVSFLLAGIVAIPTLVFITASPAIFALVFGEEWREAGQLLIILMPALALKFVVSTVSGVFANTGNNRLSALWKVAAFVVTTLMFVTLAGSLEVKRMFMTMMAIDIALYLAYYYLIWYAIRNPKDYP